MVYGLQRLNNKSILGEAFKRLSKRSTLPKSAFSWKEKIENKMLRNTPELKSEAYQWNRCNEMNLQRM